MSIFELFAQTYPRLLQGLWMTIELTLVSLLIAAVLGLLFGLLSVSRTAFLRGISRVYIDIIRGTPLIVQVFFIYFGIPSALNMRLDAFIAGVIALSLNAGAYTAEIVRGGIITLKDSSLVSVIGLAELTQTGRLIIANNFESLKMWIIIGVMYFIPIMILSKVSSHIERKMSYGKSKN